MIDLPDITTKRLAIKLKPTAEKKLRANHPWVFSNSIIKINQEGKSGDISVIYTSKKNQFLALGLYDPDSPIRIKVIQFHEPALIDNRWFQTKIKNAFEKRRELLKTRTNSYRLIFGENDGFPGLIADVYNDVLVVKIYSAIWYPYLKMIFPILLNESDCNTLVLRLSRILQKRDEDHDLYDGQILHGDLSNEVVLFNEHDIKFSANLIHGHKTGYFLDHRHNRKRVGDLAKNKKVLDVFSYAGGFTVHALAKGASSVTSIDISAQALEMAKRNVALNLIDGTHHIIKDDAFKALQSLIDKKKKYDIVVIDPPSFAKSQKEIESAKLSYARLADLGKQLVMKNGVLVMASCSSRITPEEFFNIVEKIISRSCKKYKIIDKTYHDSDHPITFPEGGYLKTGYYQLLE